MMMKKTILVLTCVLIVIIIFSCKNNVKKGALTKSLPKNDVKKETFTDPRDNKTYKTVKIGNQTWMAENLAYEIPGKQITDSTTWKNNSAYDGWCYYDNDKTAYGKTYGILYQWEAAKTVCPKNWHLPNYAEWTELTDYLGGKNIAGGKLKETGTTHWKNPNKGATNESGFTAVPSGYRSSYGVFYDIGNYGFWWKASEQFSVYVCYKYLSYHCNSLDTDGDNKQIGISVRCIKN